VAVLKATSLDTTRISDTVARLIDEHHVPGISVGVVSGDNLIYAEGFGLADIESGTPMTPEHRQRIASITKTMVGLCAMALVDEGRLRLEDRVADLLPDVPLHGPAESLTVWHLLTHTGGIGEVPAAELLPEAFTYLYNGAAPTKLLTANEAYPDGVTIEVAPGTKWAYANHGYLLLGEIISRIEHQPVAEVLSRRIFQPLGMANSDLLDEPHPGLSTGYHHLPLEEEREMMIRVGMAWADDVVVDGHNARGKHLYGWFSGAAGGAQSTIPDMAKYAAALLRKGAGIVRPETFDSMVSRHWSPDPRLPAWGLSFSVRTRLGRPSYGHGGSAIGGWNSQISLYPQDDLAVLIHMNIMYEKFDTAIMPAIQAAILGIEPNALSDVPPEPHVLATVPGVYEASMPGPLTNFRVMTGCGRVQVSARDGGLVLHARRGPWKEGIRMLPADASQPDLFVLATGDPDPPAVVAVQDAAGATTGLHFAGLMHLHRTDRVQPWV
jgi:CubicO group peptidase (beta-lactamase class C family)